MCSNARLPVVSLLPSSLLQASPHDVPYLGSSLHRSWVPCNLETPLSKVHNFFTASSSQRSLMAWSSDYGNSTLAGGERVEVICISSFVIFKFLIGVFSFLLLLCCRSTNSFRASLVPFHSSLGLATFVLAITTAIAGITEAAFYKTR